MSGHPKFDFSDLFLLILVYTYVYIYIYIYIPYFYKYQQKGVPTASSNDCWLCDRWSLIIRAILPEIHVYFYWYISKAWIYISQRKYQSSVHTFCNCNVKYLRLLAHVSTLIIVCIGLDNKWHQGIRYGYIYSHQISPVSTGNAQYIRPHTHTLLKIQIPRAAAIYLVGQ